jgi:hypothetical protein
LNEEIKILKWKLMLGVTLVFFAGLFIGAAI